MDCNASCGNRSERIAQPDQATHPLYSRDCFKGAEVLLQDPFLCRTGTYTRYSAACFPWRAAQLESWTSRGAGRLEGVAESVPFLRLPPHPEMEGRRAVLRAEQHLVQAS